MRNVPLFASRLSQLMVSQGIHYHRPLMHLLLDLLILLQSLYVSLDSAAYLSFDWLCGVVVEVVVVCPASRTVRPKPAFVDCRQTWWRSVRGGA
jgi:hypothetical protein